MRISDWSSDVCSSDLSLFADITLPAASRSDLDSSARTQLDQPIPIALQNSIVEVCHLPISKSDYKRKSNIPAPTSVEIGRASCRERVCPYVSISEVAVSFNKKTKRTTKKKNQN